MLQGPCPALQKAWPSSRYDIDFLELLLLEERARNLRITCDLESPIGFVSGFCGNGTTNVPDLAWEWLARKCSTTNHSSTKKEGGLLGDSSVSQNFWRMSSLHKAETWKKRHGNLCPRNACAATTTNQAKIRLDRNRWSSGSSLPAMMWNIHKDFDS